MYIMTCDSKINLFVSHIDHGAYMSAGGGCHLTMTSCSRFDDKDIFSIAIHINSS